MRNKFVWLLAALLSLPLVMLSSRVYATSPYDNAYNHVDQLKIVQNNYNGVTCDPLDITTTYLSYLNNAAKWYPNDTANSAIFQTYKDSFAQATQTGSWTVGVVLVNDGNGGYSSVVRINWFESDPGKLVFKGTSPNTQVELQSTTDTTGHYAFISTIDFSRPYGSTDAGNCTPHVYAVGDFAANAYQETYAVVSTEGTFSWAPTSSSEMGHWANLFATPSNVQYPAGYEGATISTDPPAATYVAMGDSFSSGEGNPAFEAGTDANGVNECHRSSQAYPRLLQNTSSLNMGLTAFVACSGATTANVLNGGSGDGNWGEGAQVDALSSDTEVVTITIGGNDVGFSAFATECLFPVDTYLGHEGTCDEFTPIYTETVDSITNELPAKLESTYSAILADAPNATIYVGGYPEISPYKYIDDPFDQDCGGLYDEWPNTWGDARAAYDVVNLLNSTIENAVDSVNTAESSVRLVYIDVTSGSFLGHDVCSSDSYFNGIYWPSDTEYSIHPNADGQLAYKEDIQGSMS